MSILPIYEPKGRAREYSPLAVNLYRGCGHGCIYCYAPSAIQIPEHEFHEPKPRANIIERLNKGAQALKETGKIQQVLLCFTCDPYQPIDQDYQLARQAIQVLHKYDIPVQILTKGGSRAARDFDLFGPNDAFATTLTFIDEGKSRQWEPEAALPSDRIATIREAKKAGIHTWVSLEPVIDPVASLEIIKITHEFVDLFKVGKLNYHPLAEKINWHKFTMEVVKTLEKYNCQYYLKVDLRQYL